MVPDRSVLTMLQPRGTAMRRAARLLLALLFAAHVAVGASAQTQRPLIVFAGASLKDAFDEAGAMFLKDNGVGVKFSYAGSLALARQIEQGAPADIFASADQETMDYAANRKAIRPETRFDLLGNTLVVVAPASAALAALELAPEPFARALGTGRLAVGETASVPAGKYAKAAMQSLGLWAIAEPRLAMSDNVRTALLFVSRGEAPLGIGYATDARADPGLKVVATFPESSHPPVVYPLALTTESKHPDAARFLAFLRSDTARAVFERNGFAVFGK